jgi:hypothetical protein
MSIDLDDIESRINEGIYGDDRMSDTQRDDAFSALAEILAEVERLRYLLKTASGVELRGLASGFVFSQHGDLYAHKFRHEYAASSACGYRPRGPYQPLREEDLTCPDCIDVIRAVELASENPERGEHRHEGAE